MIESLSTDFRQHFCPKVDPALNRLVRCGAAGRLRDGSWPPKLTIDPVTMQHTNCVYRDPECAMGDNLRQDWIDFVAGVVERSRKTRAHIEAAPHQLEHA